jgi:hypothetical protein
MNTMDFTTATLLMWNAIPGQTPALDPVSAAAKPIAGLIYEYGGWGLSAILMFVIWRMAKYILELHKEQKDEAKEQYKQLIETLSSNKTALDSLKEALLSFLNRIE